MKRKICALFMTVVLMVCGMVTAFAYDYAIAYDSAYDADTDTVTVTVYIKNAVGVQSGSLFLTYDPDMFEYKSVEEATGSSAIVVAGQTQTDETLLSCAFMFAEECVESDCDDEGNLLLATYTFTPAADDYDIDDFYLQAGAFDIEDGDIADQLDGQGNEDNAQAEEDIVVRYDTDSSDSSSDDDSGTKWYVYVIIGIVAAAAIAAVVVLVIRSNRMDNDEDEENGEADTEDKSENTQSTESDTEAETETAAEDGQNNTED
ncbi:MAG: cohesin domain-containing protein [Clostridiales bacterium]|nr:cohesin domain-containing protein [Clostridiales bacterium]